MQPMKTYLHIVVLLLLMVMGCARTVDDGVEEVVATLSLLELSAIDSLMWRQADSALTVMLEFVGSDVADSLDEFNGHYCQVLVAELLYKNDWKQSNRAELQQAVNYFDSLTLTLNDPPHASKSHCGLDPQSPNRNDNIVFLSARAHYINGVGFYEQGDVVNACAEYLKALEVMEAHFEERELVGHKARFLAYTYNRLGDLFSEQFMMESAISCYENALVYCKISPTSPIGIPNILYRIGKQFDKKNEIENASLYYAQALENMAATDNMVYRNIVASKALCDYEMNGDVNQALDELNYTLIHARTDNEQLNRYLTIGGIHFLERNYDSAIFYLEPVFENNEAGLQAQAAGYLRIVYDSIGDVEKSNVYMRFLTNQKKPDGESKALVSKLEGMYKNYSSQKLEKQAEAERKKAEKRVMNTIIPIAITVALAIFCVLIWRDRRQLKHQQEKADRAFGEAKLKYEKELRLRQVEADKTLEETKKKYEGELRQMRVETDQQLEEVERKHQQRMAEAKERHSEELRTQKDRADKEIEKTKKRHEELEAERLAYQAEMAEKEANAQAERRLHEEALIRHQVETEQRMTAAERKHQQKLKETARKHELEMLAQQDKTKKEAEQTRKRHALELEAERMAYQKEREALRQNLRQREEQVNALETAMVQQREEAERRREAFLKEPICQHINELLHGRHITTRDTWFKHEAIALKEEDYKQLKEAVERHYAGFDNALLSRCPSLRHSDLALCHLHLMGVGEGEIAALRSRTYSGIKKQNESLQEKLGVKESLAELVLRVAEGLVGSPDGVLSEVAWDETQRHSQKSSQKIVDLIKERPEITTAEMAERIGVSRRSIVNITNRLREEGVIRRVGPDKGGRWEVIG